MKKFAIAILLVAFCFLLTLKIIQDRKASQPVSVENASPGPTDQKPMNSPKYASNGAFILGGNPANPPVPVSSEQMERESEAKANDLYQALLSLTSARADLSSVQTDLLYRNARELASSPVFGVKAFIALLQYTNNVRIAKASGLTSLPTLRAVFLDSLGQIMGEESIAAQRSLLSTITDPLEMGLLARNIDRQASGKYNKELITAASRQLESMAVTGQSGEAANLFKIIQKQLTSDLLDKLTPKMDQWQYYSALALGDAPEGVGFGTLLNRAQSPSASSGEKTFAWKIVGQSSARNVNSGRALADAASAGRIPDAAWPDIAQGLAGPQYSYSAPVTDPAPYAQKPGTTFHIDSGNQNYFSQAPGNLTPAEIQSKIQMINQLLANAISQAEILSLQSALSSLMQRSR
jgi:hypothetical protein